MNLPVLGRQAPVFTVSVLILALFACGCSIEKSGLSHCVVVETKEHFTGQWLMHSESKKEERIPTQECKKLDKEIDGRDGEKAGKVRWIECLKGPDCEEPAMR